MTERKAVDWATWFADFKRRQGLLPSPLPKPPEDAPAPPPPKHEPREPGSDDGES
jgi:hypothetical protein